MTDRPLIDSVIAGFYDAAVDLSQWPDAMRAVAALLDLEMAVIHAIDANTDETHFFAEHGVPGEAMALYAEHYHTVDCRLQFCLDNPGIPVVVDYQHITEAEMDRDPFYAEFLAPFGVRYYAGAKILENDGLTTVVSFHRSPGKGHLQQDEIASVSLLLGHLRRAAGITRMLAGTEMRATAAADFADTLASGVVLLDRRGRVVFANAVARAVAARGDALALGDAGIAALHPADDHALQPVIASALAVAGGRAISGGGELALARRGADRPYMLTVSPLGRRVPVFGAEPPAVAVLIGDPDAVPELPAAALQRRWGLTPREAEVALQLGAGRSLAEVAGLLALSPRTVQVHLGHVFEKTGTHRQADLVRLLMAAPRPPGHGDGGAG